MTLGEFIKEYRLTHGISQAAFSSISGISKGYISMLEQNKNPATGLPLAPSIEIFGKVASAIGISIDELLRIVDSSQPITLTNSSPVCLSKTPNLESEIEYSVNVVKLAGRDGRYLEKRLSDAQLSALMAMVEQLPDAEDL